MSGHNKHSETVESSSYPRRWLLKTGAAAGFAGLAGCSGSGNDGGDSGGSDGSGASNGDGGGQTTQSGSQSSDASITYFASIFANSEQARQRTKKLIGDYESSTGATVKTSYDGPGPLLDGSWVNLVSKESYPSYPVLFDSPTNFNGPLYDTGSVAPVSEYREYLDDEALSEMEWLMPMFEDGMALFDEDLLSIPFGLLPMTPFIARTDHFEQAGLDPESDFPPDDFDHLIEVATTLQKDGPADYGFPLYGATFDVLDEFSSSMAFQIGGDERGDFVTSDGSDTNYGNDVWGTVLQRLYDIQHTHGLSYGGAPSGGDEAIVNQIISGRAGFASINFLNHPTLMSRGQEMMQDGTIQWAPSYEGPSGQKGNFFPWAFSITRKPESVSQSKWDTKVEAAAKLMNKWLSAEQQKRMFEDYGVLPVRQDVWDELSTPAHRGPQSMRQMAKGIDNICTVHPNLVTIQYSGGAPIVQKMLQDEIGPSEANTQLREMAMNNL